MQTGHVPASIHHLFARPVKGMLGLSQGSFDVRPGIGVYGNRQFSFARKGMDPGSAWAKPMHFYNGKTTAALANILPAFQMKEGNFDHLNVETRQLSSACLAQVAERLGIPLEELQVINTKGQFNMADTEGDFISLGNLGTIHQLEKMLDVVGLAERFHMDAYFMAPPCAEYAWVKEYPGKMRLQMGEIECVVDDACDRCKAIHANPRTGCYDLGGEQDNITEALFALMKEHDYLSPHRPGKMPVLGVLVKPLNAGRIYINDQITFLGA